jgi:acyl-CoA reductase-like NAD-dependent aldehyde dehydrogenase
VLLDPPDDATVGTEEIFGPVICVCSAAGIDDAIARANALPYAFQAAVCTGNLDTAFRVDWMPFAGLGQSGHGVGGIHQSMHEMQIEKMMVVRSNEL